MVASGTYIAPELTLTQVYDFNSAPETILATGLSLAAGSYYLVLDGSAGPLFNNQDWIGDQSAVLSTAVGFSVDGYYSVGSFLDPLPTPAAFGPSADFALFDDPRQFAFSVTGDIGAVPEPASWAMLIAGFGLIGGAMRRRPNSPYRQAI